MSTDFNIVCDECKLQMHAGQFMGGSSSFGYGSTDAEGRQAVSDFAFEHAYHNFENGTRIVISDTTEVKRSDKYMRVDDSDPAIVAAVAIIKDGVEHAEAMGHSIDIFLAATASNFIQRFGETISSKLSGSGDFSIGSKLWPGVSKVIEEMGELQQVLGKLIAVAGETKHWDGDLRPKLIEEIGDLRAALQAENFTPDESHSSGSGTALRTNHERLDHTPSSATGSRVLRRLPASCAQRTADPYPRATTKPRKTNSSSCSGLSLGRTR